MQATVRIHWFRTPCKHGEIRAIDAPEGLVKCFACKASWHHTVCEKLGEREVRFDTEEGGER